MNYLHLRTRNKSVDTSRPDPTDSWDRADTHTTWYVEGLGLQDTDYSDSVPNYLAAKVGDTLWVLYAVYSTGDSFGRDEDANLEFINVFARREDAITARHSLADGNPPYTLSNGQTITFGWIPWNGYFESLSYM